MALYILLYILHFILMQSVYCGVYHHTAAAVFNHGLPDLNKDIRQRIRTASSQQGTHFYFPIVAAPSKGYEVVEHEPYEETASSQESKKSKSKASGEKKEGGGKEYSHKGHKKSSGHHSDHHSEAGKKGHSGKENKNKKYAEDSGKKTEYEDKDHFGHEHHHEKGGKGESGFKEGAKRDKAYVHKGFRDIYHKDEVKKLDSFWNNHHTEGKWYKYGTHKHDHHEKDKKKKSEKHEKESKEEDEYKKEKCTNCKE